MKRVEIFVPDSWLKKFSDLDLKIAIETWLVMNQPCEKCVGSGFLDCDIICHQCGGQKWTMPE